MDDDLDVGERRGSPPGENVEWTDVGGVKAEEAGWDGLAGEDGDGSEGAEVGGEARDESESVSKAHAGSMCSVRATFDDEGRRRTPIRRCPSSLAVVGQAQERH